jgi:hypothetical protein
LIVYTIETSRRAVLTAAISSNAESIERAASRLVRQARIRWLKTSRWVLANATLAPKRVRPIKILVGD